MKIVHNKNALPRDWKAHPNASGILVERDISVLNGSRLRAKLLVFDSRKNLRSFWMLALNSCDLGKKTMGAVNGLAQEILRVDATGKTTRHHIRVDPRYFCIIGLSAPDLCYEVITHESCHAAFNYTKRVKLKEYWPNQESLNDEESVCYPTGIIAREIHRTCHNTGMYKLSKLLIQK